MFSEFMFYSNLQEHNHEQCKNINTEKHKVNVSFFNKFYSLSVSKEREGENGYLNSISFGEIMTRTIFIA